MSIALIIGIILGYCANKILEYKPPKPEYLTIDQDIEFNGITYFNGPVIICNDNGCWSFDKTNPNKIYR